MKSSLIFLCLLTVNVSEGCRRFWRSQPIPTTTSPPTTTLGTIPPPTTEQVSTTELDSDVYMRELTHEIRALLTFLHHPEELTFSKLERSFGEKSKSNASLVYAFVNLTEINLLRPTGHKDNEVKIHEVQRSVYRSHDFIPCNYYISDDFNATIAKSMIDLLLWTSGMFVSYSISEFGNCDNAFNHKQLLCDVFIQNLTVNLTQQAENVTLADDCLYTIELVYIRALSKRIKIGYSTFFVLENLQAIYPAFKTNNMTSFDMAMARLLEAIIYKLPRKMLVAPF